MFSVIMNPWDKEEDSEVDETDVKSNCDLDVHPPPVHSALILNRCSVCQERLATDFESFCLKCKRYLPDNNQLPVLYDALTTLSMAYDDCDTPLLGQAK